MARVKPDPYIVADMKEAEGAMAELAQVNRKLARIVLDTTEGIDALKKKAAQESESLNIRKKELENAIAVYARMNRGELFVGRESVELAFGVFGFRASSRIVQCDKVPTAFTLDKLEEFGFMDAIRISKEVNRDAMQNWTDEKLLTVGLRRRKSDGFYIKTFEDRRLEQ